MSSFNEPSKEADAPSPAGAPPPIPTERELRRPYFLLHTPDGARSYFDKNVYRLVASYNSPLSGFLARAELVEKNKTRDIHYSFEDIDASTLRPMEHLPAAVIEDFRQYAEEFLKSVEEDAKVPEHEKELRRHFKLPDPDLEQDAYWLYGPPNAPRLLVLWGCEKQQNTSLPLLPLKATKAGGNPLEEAETVYGKLKKREVTWQVMQRETYKQVRRDKEPLARFLAFPAYNEEGELQEVETLGETVAAKELKPFSKFTKKEFGAFSKAAKHFYERVHPDKQQANPVEVEHRKNFRLPDPDKHPECYKLDKGRLLILAKDTPKDESLPPTAFDPLGVPEEPVRKVRGEEEPRTVVEKLKSRVSGTVTYLIWGGIAAVAAVAFLVVGNLEDTTPPSLRPDSPAIAENDPTNIRVHFTETLDQKTVRPAGFTVSAPDGTDFVIKDASLYGNDDQVSLLLNDDFQMELGQTYALTVTGVADKSGNKIQPPDNTAKFVFRDTQPPELSKVSAGLASTEVLLVVTEAVNRADASRPANYTVNGKTPRSVEVGEDNRRITLTMDDQLEDGQPYPLEIHNISDLATPPNTIDHESEFRYLDLLPPQFTVSAERAQTVVTLIALEEIKITAGPPESAFEIEGLDVWEVELQADGETVILRTEPMYPGRTYELRVQGVEDMSDPPNKLTGTGKPITFEYKGPVDRQPPELRRGTAPERDRIILSYSEELDPRKLGAYTVGRASGRDTVSVGKVSLRADELGNMRNVEIILDGRMNQATPYRVIGKGVADINGNIADVSTQVAPAGLVINDQLLRIQQVELLENGKKVKIDFNEAVADFQTADFEVTGHKITGVERGDSDKSVTLTLESPVSGEEGAGLYIYNAKLRDAPHIHIDPFTRILE